MLSSDLTEEGHTLWMRKSVTTTESTQVTTRYLLHFSTGWMESIETDTIEQQWGENEVAKWTWCQTIFSRRLVFLRRRVSMHNGQRPVESPRGISDVAVTYSLNFVQVWWLTRWVGGWFLPAPTTLWGLTHRRRHLKEGWVTVLFFDYLFQFSFWFRKH